MSKTLDPGHSRSPSHGSVAYLPVYSAVPIPEYQNSTHTLPVLPKTEPTPRHDPRALSMYAYTAQVEKAPADAMTSYNAVYNTSNNRASVLTHSKSMSTTGTLYETVPIQSHAQGDYLHEPQDSKRVASLTASIGSSNVHVSSSSLQILNFFCTYFSRTVWCCRLITLYFLSMKRGLALSAHFYVSDRYNLGGLRLLVHRHLSSLAHSYLLEPCM
jgi:hypothetical protein